MSRSKKIREAVDRFEEAVLLAAMEGCRQAERGVGFKGLSEVDRFGEEYLTTKRDLLSLVGVVARPLPRRRRRKLANG